MSLAAVDYHSMRLYQTLKRVDVPDALLYRICCIAVERKIRAVASWRVMQVSTLITLGLSYAEACSVRGALQRSRDDASGAAAADNQQPTVSAPDNIMHWPPSSADQLLECQQRIQPAQTPTAR